MRSSTSFGARTRALRADMIVLDANILIRAVLGRRVRTLLESYSKTVRFYAPETAFLEAETYLPALSRKMGLPEGDVCAAVAYFSLLVESVGREVYGLFEEQARHRLRGRDEHDWPVLATALSRACPIWTEDADLFGTGVAVWTSDRVEIYLKQVAGA